MIPILYVDDESVLLDVTKLYMEKDGEFSLDTSLSAEDALQKLEETSYEAVIADYQMPGLDGLEFLKILRAKYPLLPFILFTGKGREEVAIEALNSGADFYLQKGGEPKSQFAELKNKVQQLIRRRAAEKALAESREKYRGIVDNAPMGIFHSTPEGTLLDVNPAFVRMFGSGSPNEFIAMVNSQGGTITLYADPENRTEIIQKVLKSGGWQSFETRFRRIDGSIFDVMLTFRSYENSGGRPEFEGFIADITESRKAQARIAASERRYRNVFESASDAMLVEDRDTGAVLDANSAAVALYQYSTDEFRALKIPDITAEVPPGKNGSGISPEPVPVTYHQRKDGTPFPVEVTESTYPQKNRTITILSIRDITSRQQAEERALATRRLYIVLSEINEAIVRVRDLGTLLDEICRITVEHGHFRMAWIGLVDREQKIIRPVAHAGFEDGYLSDIHIPLDTSPEGSGPTGIALRTGGPVFVEDIATDPRMEPWREKATLRGYRSSAAVPFSLHGEVVGILNLYASGPGFFTGPEVMLLSDITEDLSFALGLLDEQARRARAEQALAGSEEYARLLASIIGMSSQPFFIGYLDGRFGVVNPAFCGLLGYTKAEIGSLSWKDLTPPEFAGTEAQEIEDVIASGVPRRYEKEFIRKDGTRVPVEVFAHRAMDHGSDVQYLYSFVTDITERRQVLSECQLARKEWMTIFSAIGNPALILDPSQTILEANDAVLRLTKKTPEELRTMKCWQVFHSVESTGPPDGCPFERMKKSGKVETSAMEVAAFGGVFLVSCTPVRDESGKLSRVIHIATDITGIKQAEQALSDSETRYRTIFEKSTDAVLLMNGTILDCNPAAERMWGLPRNRIIGHDPVEFSPPVQPDGTASRDAAATYKLAACEWGNQFFPWRYQRKDGTLIDTDVSLTSVMVGRERRLIAIIRDVTARKQAAETIEKSEAMLRQITDSVSDMVWLTDLDLVPVYISPSVVRLRGFTLQELQKLPLERRLAPESCALALEIRDRLLGQGTIPGKDLPESLTIELELYKKDHSTFWSENTVTLVRDEDNRPFRILLVGRDITERKLLENQVLRIASFPELNPEPIIEITVEKELMYANPACRERLKKLRMPDDPAAFFPPDIDEIIISLKESRSDTVVREVPVGDAVFAESLTLSPGGLAVRIHAHDITERHQMTGALARANRKLNLLSGITRHDIRNRLTAVLGYLELARTSTPDPALIEYISRSEASAVGIRHLIEFTKEYETLGSTAPVWHDVTALIASARAQLDLHGITLEDDVSGLFIYADPMFARVIVHLADNALRHGGAQLSRIRFSGTVTPDGYMFVCEDDGAGIDKKEKAAIFRRVVGRDTNMGLFLVREILSLTNIVIRETGEPGKGARFELMIPPGGFRAGRGKKPADDS